MQKILILLNKELLELEDRLAPDGDLEDYEIQDISWNGCAAAVVLKEKSE